MPNFSLRRDAFSMLELVFVIVILAIVASIGSQIIVKVYDSYITQRAIHRSSLKTELAATQLANRLAYSIPGTVIGRSQANPLVFNAVENIPVNAERDILEWIAYDSDSFGAVDNPAGTGLQRSPVWSGYADVDAIIAAGNRDEVLTPGSRLTDLAAIIGNLSGGGSNVANTAVFFPDGYHAHNVGYIEAARDFNGSHQVAGINGDSEARIFCQHLDAELLSIAGQYRVSEDLSEDIRGKAAHIYLEGSKLKIEPLEGG